MSSSAGSGLAFVSRDWYGYGSLPVACSKTMLKFFNLYFPNEAERSIQQSSAPEKRTFQVPQATRYTRHKKSTGQPRRFSFAFI